MNSNAQDELISFRKPLSRPIGMSEERFNFIKEKYLLSASSMKHLTLCVPFILSHDAKRQTYERVERACDKLQEALAELKLIKVDQAEFFENCLPLVNLISINGAKLNLENAIGDLGMFKMHIKDKNSFYSNGNVAFVESAESKRTESRCMQGIIKFKLKKGKKFNYQLQYVHELQSLLFFWFNEKGKISNTNPESRKNDDGNCFYTFCSEVLNVDNLSPPAVYQKFKDNFDVEYG